MALFRMLWIVVSSLWVSAEDAQPCPKGYFCPAESRQPVLCPAQHYCPAGSTEPLPCPSGNVCKGQEVEALVNGTWGDLVPLAAGAYHTVVVAKSGQIWAAGGNDDGQLGTGNTVGQHALVHVAFDGKKIVAVATGDSHSAAITESGELWTWGFNGDGELGVGDTTSRHAPVCVSVNGQKIVAVAAGGGYTAAITESGELWTWGCNDDGQLGVGDTKDRAAPVKVSVNGQKVVAVAAGYWHTAVITESGELWTWGCNDDGQLGVGDTKDRAAPVKVSVNGQKVVAVAAGYWHTAVITESGELWTWGYNGDGELGVGDTTSRHAPVCVSVNGQKIVAVAAGGGYTAAITESGELWTWGCNDDGQLGVGDTKDRAAPVKVSVNGQKVVAVAAGYWHTAVITESGELWTWGYNGDGELGVGDTTSRHAPVKTALRGKIGKLHDPLCWSIQGWEPSALGEAFLAATWGSQIPVPRQCSALQDRLAAFLQKCRVQVRSNAQRVSFAARPQAFPCGTVVHETIVPDEHNEPRHPGIGDTDAVQSWAVVPAREHREVVGMLTHCDDLLYLLIFPQSCTLKLRSILVALLRPNREFGIAPSIQSAAGEAASPGDSRGIQSRVNKTEAERAGGGRDTAWDFRGTDSLDIWYGLVIVSALAAGSVSVFVGIFGWSGCSSPVTQYDHRGRRVLKIRSPNISIHDVSVRHFGLRVEVDLGHRGAKPLQTRLRSSLAAFEFRQDETVMEDGFLYLHFAESAERRYEFPAPDGGSWDASEGTENSFEYVALGEEELNGASV
ncbi:UVR8 [Symbiodinium sp. CCMP2592]|nr:UVR8 [Symbiodinium sp. CCMP2592]